MRRANLVLSARGMILLLFVAYLITGPVIYQADIVAAIVAYGLLALVCLVNAIVLISGILIRRDLSLTLNAPAGDAPAQAENTAIESGTPVLLILRTTPVRVLPLFELQLKLEFEHEDLKLPLHRLKGAASGRRYLQESLTFPHRGIWKAKRISLAFVDQLGLGCFNWEIPASNLNQNFTVRPPVVQDEHLPILSSCQRSGDAVIDIHDRRGDLYDLKQYHPSDGMHKIVWKIYAKAGKLISRHPEPSMTPEGQVVVFCLAGLMDDAVCSTALAYLRRLEDLSLEIFFGCEGMRPGCMAQSAQAAEALLIESAWHTAHSNSDSLRRDLQNFLAKVNSALRNESITRILLFCSATRLRSQEMVQAYLNAGETLQGISIDPVYCIPAADAQLARRDHARSRVAPLPALLKRTLLESQETEITATPSLYPEFMSACLKKRWQVLN